MVDYKGPELELKCVNTIRAVSADQPESANSGHPGAPMGCAPFAYLLWAELMKYSGSDPKWLGRDRFVLSNGHACALQYTMLHLTKYGLTKEDLGQFRQLGGPTPGHPECFVTSGTYLRTVENVLCCLQDACYIIVYSTPTILYYDMIIQHSKFQILTHIFTSNHHNRNHNRNTYFA
jgi:hypothetical protein